MLLKVVSGRALPVSHENDWIRSNRGRTASGPPPTAQSTAAHPAGELTFLRMALSQSHAGSSTVLVDELDPSTLERADDGGECRCITCIAPGFNIRDRIAMNPGGLCQIPHAPIQGSPSHPHLCTCHRH